MRFLDMPLSEELKTGLSNLEFSRTTEVQAAVIPQVLGLRDVIVCAQTGSGKTAAYGVPMVERLLEDHQYQGLVLAPTRELAQQIAGFLRDLTANQEKMTVTSLVGGADMKRQMKALKKKPRIVVATPGRLSDHLRRKNLHLHNMQMLVIDEGDRMLDMGFAPQIDEILKHMPKQRQTMLLTATLPPKVNELSKKYLRDPKFIQVGRQSQPAEKVRQSVIQVAFKEKDDRVLDELNQRDGQVIIFARTRNRTDILTRHLREYGFSVSNLHSGKSQGQRNKSIQEFKRGKIRILCATDIAARGIDVPQVEHVINFDLPMQDEDYVHRIGRTARNGAEGEALSFVMPEEHQRWNDLVKKYKIRGVEIFPVSSGGPKPWGRKKAKKKKKVSATRSKTPGKKLGKKTTSSKPQSASSKHSGSKPSGSAKSTGPKKMRSKAKASAGPKGKKKVSKAAPSRGKPSKKKSFGGKKNLRGGKAGGGKRSAHRSSR